MADLESLKKIVRDNGYLYTKDVPKLEFDGSISKNI